jgi:hypothetical protein
MLDPAIHTADKSAWTTGSFGTKTALRAFSPVVTKNDKLAA